MTESNEEREKRELRELEGKNVVHYQVLLSAWIESRMEQDKTIITLSAGAIALLVTIITTVGIKGFWQYLFATTAFAGFITAICSCLPIYQLNAKHLEENLRSESTENTSNLLKKLDKITIRSFYTGIVCFVLMALFVSFQKTGGLTMAEKKQGAPKKVEKIQESVSGIKKLSPQEIEIGKSLEGINNLSPQNLKPSSSASSQEANATQDTNATQSGQENAGDSDKK